MNLSVVANLHLYIEKITPQLPELCVILGQNVGAFELVAWYSFTRHSASDSSNIQAIIQVRSLEIHIRCLHEISIWSGVRPEPDEAEFPFPTFFAMPHQICRRRDDGARDSCGAIPVYEGAIAAFYSALQCEGDASGWITYASLRSCKEINRRTRGDMG